MTSVFDHPWLGGLFADPEMATIWSAEVQLRHYLAFEAAWSRAGHLGGMWSKADGQDAALAIEAIDIHPAALADGVAKDGVPIPALVRLLKEKTGAVAIHQGATSQDLVDTALALTMQASAALLVKRLETLAGALDELTERFGANPLMGRTRMQAAESITVADRVAAWRMPLDCHRDRLAEALSRGARLSVGGAAGNRSAIDPAVVASIEQQLGLPAGDKAWHAMRDGVAEFASVLSLISGTTGKMGQDIALMAQQGVDEIGLSGGGGSSAMPHKQNPVGAELLVTLARYNATQVAGVHQALVHEQERSGAAWALEWMILPQMAQATGRALATAIQLCARIERIGTP